MRNYECVVSRQNQLQKLICTLKPVNRISGFPINFSTLNPVLTTYSDIVIEHIDFYVSVHACNMPHKSSSAWRPPRLGVHRRASMCVHQSRVPTAPCKQGFTLQSRHSICSIGHRYRLSAVSLLRYRISVVSKLSISV